MAKIAKSCRLIFFHAHPISSFFRGFRVFGYLSDPSNYGNFPTFFLRESLRNRKEKKKRIRWRWKERRFQVKKTGVDELYLILDCYFFVYMYKVIIHKMERRLWRINFKERNEYKNIKIYAKIMQKINRCACLFQTVTTNNLSRRIAI